MKPMDVKEVLLPGVGLRFEFENRDGDRIGVVARRTGEFEVVVYPSDDPDQAQQVFRLTDDEADALAQILGAPRIAERFADLTREVPGLNAGQVTIRPGSPFVDRPLGDTRARTRTGASIVAIVRDEEVLASPGPAEMLRATTYWWSSAPRTASRELRKSSRRAIWPVRRPKVEPMQVSATLLLELGVILTVLTVLGTAARRFALSPIPLYLVAGLALGEGGIAPIPAAAQFVSTGASIGVVLLLLTLGLEFSIGEFASSLRRHLPSAWVDVLLNAVPGAIAGWLLGLNGVGILALAGRHVHLVVRCDRAAAVRPAPARQQGDPGRAVDPRARGLRDGGLPAAAGRPGRGGHLAGGPVRHGDRHRGAQRGVLRVLPLGPPRRPDRRAP